MPQAEAGLGGRAPHSEPTAGPGPLSVCQSAHQVLPRQNGGHVRPGDPRLWDAVALTPDAGSGAPRDEYVWGQFSH